MGGNTDGEDSGKIVIGNMEDQTPHPQSRADDDEPTHDEGAEMNVSLEADLLHLDEELRATDRYVGELLRAENDALIDSSSGDAIKRIFEASERYLEGGQRGAFSNDLELTDGDPRLLVEWEDKRTLSSVGRLRNQDNRLTWRGVAAMAALILFTLTLSIIYSGGNGPKLTPPPEETALVASSFLDSEMAALWDALDDLEEEVFMAANRLPLTESASYWAMLELDDAIGDLEEDLGAF